MNRSRQSRRRFLAGGGGVVAGILLSGRAGGTGHPDGPVPGLPPHARWGYLIDPSKCIGCGNCMRACRVENNVPTRAGTGKSDAAAAPTPGGAQAENAGGAAPAAAKADGAGTSAPPPAGTSPEGLMRWIQRYRYTSTAGAQNTPDTHSAWRTWVERYLVLETENGTSLRVDAPCGGEEGYPPVDAKVLKGFFVPKLCNHCVDPPCVKVCPTSSTYVSPEGIVLVDDKWCIGCGYCIQACAYDMRYMDHRFGRGVADKCTWCYHRITRKLLPACVLACPTEARRFGDLTDEKDPVRRIFMTQPVQVLRPDTGNDPQVRYTQLAREVR